MLIRQKKSWLIIILVLIVLSLLLLTINKQKVHEEYRTLIEKTLSLDLGISSLNNILEGGVNIEISPKDKIIPLIISIPKMINYKLFHANKFDRIDIDINFRDYLTLMKDRDRAIKNQLLVDPTKVDVTIKYMDKVYKAELRLKGDHKNHWVTKHRMSLRVQLKNEKTILGFSAFSIQKPGSRDHPYDYTFQSLVRDTGGIAPVHKFAHVFVNGEDWGIMDIEEHMSKELLEKQNRKESVIVRFGNEETWIYALKSKKPYLIGAATDYYRISNPFIFLHLYNNKSLKNAHNRKMYSYILKNRLSNSNIYDIDSFSKAFILSLVWNNMHTLKDYNSRYYFNPYTLKLEPITTDQQVWSEIQDENTLTEEYIRILSNKKFLEHLPMNLEIVNKTVSNIDKHFSYIQSLFPVDKKKSTKIIEDNMKKILSNKEKYLVYPINKSKGRNYTETPEIRDLTLLLNNKPLNLQNTYI